jgi:hypothetical protein
VGVPSEERKRKSLERLTSWGRAHPERVKEVAKAWREANKEKVAAYRNAYYEKRQAKRFEQNKPQPTDGPEVIKARRAAYKHQWYLDNHERTSAERKARNATRKGEITQASRKYYLANKEKMLAASKAWKLKNPERYDAAIRRWRAENAEYLSDKKRESTHARRSLINCAEGTHTAADIRRIWERQKHKCAIPKCAYPITDKCRHPDRFHIDHIKALKNGGSNYPDNIQILCRTHNLQKNAADDYEFAQRHGLLFFK